MPADRNSLRMALAQQLMGGTGMGPPMSIGAGLSDVGTKLAGAMLARRTMDKEDAQRQEFAKLLSGFAAQPAQPGQDRSQALAGLLAGSGNPMAQQAGQELLIRSMLVQPKEETFGSPITAMGPEGKATLVQPGNRGTMRPVQGYEPKPEAPKAEADKWLRLPDGSYINPQTREKIFDPEAFARDLQGKAAGGTRINQQISPTAIYKSEEGASMQELFGSLGKGIAGQQERASQASQTSTTIGQLNKELEGVPTGMGAEARTQMLKALKATGISDEAANAELAKREAAGRISGGMVMDQLNAMKGPATEREREYLQQITPGLSTTPQGRAAMEAIAKHQEQRERAKADAQAAIANEVQQRQLPIGEAQRRVREANDDINRQFDQKLNVPGIGAAPKAPPPAGRKRIKIDAEGNIVR
jgi:hypothetical protein